MQKQIIFLLLLPFLFACKSAQIKNTFEFHKVSNDPLAGATPYLSVKNKSASNNTKSDSSSSKDISDAQEENVEDTQYIGESPLVQEYRQKVVRLAQQSLGRRRMSCNGLKFRADCSGWVRCVYSQLQLDMEQHSFSKSRSGVERMMHYVRAYGKLHKRKIPFPGDLVFWHYTYDKTHNGKLDNKWTHIGIVENIQKNGRISVIHYAKGVKRIFMNLTEPATYKKEIKKEQQTQYAQICEEQTQSYGICLKDYGQKACKQRKLYQKLVCKRSQKSSKNVWNSYLVSKRKRGRIYGALTGELFAGFGTVVRSPLPPHLIPKKGQLLGSRKMSLPLFLAYMSQKTQSSSRLK